MDTVTALFGWIGRTLRWVFDLASMAVGVAPTSVGLADAASVGEIARTRSASWRGDDLGRALEDDGDWMAHGVNPASGLPMSGVGYSTRDVGGNLYGSS